MAIAVDASTPAVASGSADPWTTPSFTAPAGSLLVCCVMADALASADVTLTPSSTGLTFTERARRTGTESGAQSGVAAIFTAPVASGVARTVSVTTSAGDTEDNGGLKVWVVTGAATPPVGATGEGSSTTDSITPTALTTTANGSLVIGCATEWNVLGAPTSTDDATTAAYTVAGGISGIAPRKASATAASGTAVTLNFDAFGAGAPAWNWCAVEILAAAPGPAVTHAFTGTVAVGTTSVAPSPGGTVTMAHRSLLFVGTKPSTATVVTPAAWRPVLNVTGGTGVDAADTGLTRLAVFYRDGAFSGAQTVTVTSGGTSWGVVYTAQCAATAGWGMIGSASGDDTTGASAAYSATCGADPGWADGDLVVAGICIPTDAHTAVTAQAVTATGVSGGTTTSRATATSGTGNDIGGNVFERSGATGTASAAPAVAATFTSATNTYGPCVAVRLRAVALGDTNYPWADGFPGADGTPWPPHWVTTIANVGGVSDTNTGRGRLQSGTTAFATSAQAVAGRKVTSTDFGLLVRIGFDNPLKTEYPLVAVRANFFTGSYPDTGYFCEIEVNGGQYTLRRGVAGVYAVLATVSKTFTAGVDIWFRFYCFGTALKTKIWNVGAAEPAAWDTEQTDANVTAAGYAGLSMSSGVASVCTGTFDDLAVWNAHRPPPPRLWQPIHRASFW